MAAVEVSGDTADHNYYAATNWVAGADHVIRSPGEGFIQTVVGPFVLLGNSLQGALDLLAVASEFLNEFYIVLVGHHRHFVRLLQTSERFIRSAMHFCAIRINTAAAIDQQHHRKRQAILTEMCDL